MRNNHHHKRTILPSNTPITIISLPHEKFFIVTIPRRISITIRSCTINIPIESMPNVVSVSPLSERSLRTTIVEENENQIQIYIEVI